MCAASARPAGAHDARDERESRSHDRLLGAGDCIASAERANTTRSDIEY